MGIKTWLSGLVGGGSRRGNPLIAMKCPHCNFWTNRLPYGTTKQKFYFWLPRDIGDRMGRTGKAEEENQKRKAYGRLWLEGQFAVDQGGGRQLVVPLQTTGYFDDYVATECPLCDTPYSDWSKVHVICKKCRRHVLMLDDKHLSLRCPSCGSVHHVEGVAFETPL